MNCKKIVIIGCNSYIARNLIYVLKNRFPSATLLLYDYQENQFDGYENYHQVNTLSLQSVCEIDFHCDFIFVFTGKTGTMSSFDSPCDYVDINEKSLLNILIAYRKKHSDAVVVYPSTRLVYKGTASPIKEEAEKDFKTIYSISKFACENYLRQFNCVYGVKFIIFRICVPYGSLIDNASSYGTCEYMLQKARNGEKIVLYGTGEQRRTFTFIEDVCNVLIDGSLHNECLNNIFNVGGEALSLVEVALMIDSFFHNGVDFVPWPKEQYLIESGDTVFDDRKISKILKCSRTKTFKEWINEKAFK